MPETEPMNLKPLAAMDLVITDNAVRRFSETLILDIEPCDFRLIVARTKIEALIAQLRAVDMPRICVRYDGIRLVIVQGRLIYAGAAVNFVPFRPNIAKAQAL